MTGDSWVDAGELARGSRSVAASSGRRIGDALADDLDASGLAVQDAVRRRAGRHSRTGRMARYVNVRGTGAGGTRQVRVHASGRVAHLIVGGTRPHVIRPIRRQALAIRPDGLAIVAFAADVRVRGVRPDPFVALGAQDARGDLAQLDATALARITHELSTELGG